MRRSIKFVSGLMNLKLRNTLPQPLDIWEYQNVAFDIA